jgi:hypothetical protein
MSKLNELLKDLDFIEGPNDGLGQLWTAHGSNYNTAVLVHLDNSKGVIEVVLEEDNDAPAFHATFSKWNDAIGELIAILVK